MKKITFFLIVLFMFCGCSSGQDEAAREQSSKRIAEMNQLQQQIQATDFEISKHLKLRSSAMRAAKESNSFDSNENVARYDAIINELKSKRETLVNKFNVLYKIEQENQSKL
jgi:PBP1b-binding outer membrane lipoprotein LpoB